LEGWAEGEGGDAEIAEEGGFFADGLEAVSPIEAKGGEVVGVDGEGEAGMVGGGDGVGGVSHEEVGGSVVSVVGGNAKVDEFDDIGAGDGAEEEYAEVGIVAAEEEPEVGVEVAGGFVSGEDVVDIAEAIEGGAVEALLVAGEDGLGEEVVGFWGVGEPIEIGCEGPWVEVGGDIGLKVEQFGEGLEGAGEEEGVEWGGVVVEEDLGEVDASEEGIAAGGFDELSCDLEVELAVELVWGEEEHGSAG